jgi:hypothetical protein
VEAVASRGWAQAVALYRRAPAVRGAQASGWFELLARGPADLLPSAGEIEAVATGELPRELSLGRLVFVSHEESGATALALGGILCSEDQLDSIEGLFEVLAALRGSRSPEPGLLGLFEALLPRRPRGGDSSPTDLLAVDPGARAESDLEFEPTCQPWAEIQAWLADATALHQNGLQLTASASLSLEACAVRFQRESLRRGLEQVTRWAADLMKENAGPHREGRLHLLWTREEDNTARLTLEYQGPQCAAHPQAAHSLPQLLEDLQAEGWQVRPLRNRYRPLGVMARFDLG